MLTAMDYLPSDLEHMNTNFLDMIENEVNSQQILDVENLNSDKLNDILNGDLMQESGSMDFADEDVNNSNWLQNLQWNDVSKVPQSLIDASNEVENNNPNLLVNPQSVLPVHSAPAIQKNVNSQEMNHINTLNGIPVKINGHDAVLTPTQHPQIQYVTVQNVVSLNNQQIGYTVQPITICHQQNLQNATSVTSPSLTSPVLVEHLQNGIHTQHLNNNHKHHSQQKATEKVYPKPVYSYSCLIAMALKNSRTGNLPVSEIYNFMIDNFPYFKTAPDGWKNSVRHNLSLNKCFAKAHDGKSNGTHTRKGCLWALNPAKVEKMEEEIVKWRKKDPESVKLSMSKPENLELIEQGKAGPPRESDEPSTPVKQPPVIPVKQLIQAPVVHKTLKPYRFEPKHEVTVMVKTEPEINVTDYEPGLTDLNMQQGLWDSELTIGIGNPTSQPIGCSSPLVSPTHTGPTQYHGNITYTCGSPQLTNNPAHTLTPTKLVPQTPTKLYPQTPSKLILA